MVIEHCAPRAFSTGVTVVVEFTNPIDVLGEIINNQDGASVDFAQHYQKGGTRI